MILVWWVRRVAKVLDREEWPHQAEDYPTNMASPLQILIDASNGASDYGNKFGEPLICGWTRIGSDDSLPHPSQMLPQLTIKWKHCRHPVPVEKKEGSVKGRRPTSGSSPGSKIRCRVNGFGRGGGQAVFNQILTRFHGIRLESH